MDARTYILETMPLWYVSVFVFGACVGSFLNVCIWRIPRDESIVTPPSHCPKCDYKIAWFDNLPMVSWLLLGGKCRKCGVKISFRYFGVELLTAVMFLCVWLKVIHSGEPISFLFPYLLMTAVLIVATFIDFDHGIIPNEITYFAMLAGLVFAFVVPAYWGVPGNRWLGLARSCGGLIASLGGLAIFAIVGRLIFKKEALGWGDVKYLGAVGACLGLLGSFFTILVGSLVGSVAGVGLIVFGKGKLKTAIPFGPFLAFATYLWILFGHQLLLWYIDWVRSTAIPQL